MQTLRTTVAQLTQASLNELRSRVQGEVFTPGDSRYEEARKAWNLTVDQYPALIVAVEKASDVVAAVRFAEKAGLGIGVQSTGHGTVRPVDGHLLILTSRMMGVEVDVERQTARVEAGAKWGMVLAATQTFGLAPLLGSSPNVGVVGYTLGGGMGWLTRKYGLATDSVHAFELVTPDGRLMTASASENSDLYWALRGGGGNFGVIVAMTIQLYPVTTVFGGSLIYPAEHAKTIFERYRSWIAGAPDELTSSIAIMNFPPLPVVPEFLRGQSVVMINGCYLGDLAAGEAFVQPWLEWMTPIANSFRVMPFSEVASISNDPLDPMPAKSTGAWLRDLSDEVIETLIQYALPVNGPSPLIKTEIRHAGGAMARVDTGAAAYSHRDSEWVLNLIGVVPHPDAFSRLKQHNASFMQALESHLTGGVYMNFLEGEEARARSKDAYTPETYARLTTLKAQVDPANRFRFSFDLTPDSDH